MIGSASSETRIPALRAAEDAVTRLKASAFCASQDRRTTVPECGGSGSARQSEDRASSIWVERAWGVMAEFPAVAHVAVTVTDLDRSRPWYQRLFGADPVLDEDTGPYHHVVSLFGGTHPGIPAVRSAFTSMPPHRVRSRSMSCGRGFTTSGLAVRTGPSLNSGKRI